MVYEESDETFIAFIYKTKSKKYIVAGSYATLTQEYRILDADHPDGEFKVFEPEIERQNLNMVLLILKTSGTSVQI